MASIILDPQSKKYRIRFWFGGRAFHKSLKTKDPKKAKALKGKIEDMLMAIEEGREKVPEPEDLWTVLFSGGRLEKKPTMTAALTLEMLFTRYFEEMPPGNMEQNSLATMQLHRNHLLRTLGARTAAQSIGTTDMQRYINERAKEKHHGRSISPRTIKKEISSFRAVWNWATLHGLVTGIAPTRGLKYAKDDEKPHFMTWAEIEQRIARGSSAKLWECLFLDVKQIDELLQHVKKRAAHPFIFPMFVFIAHTGARRREMIRSERDDLDFVRREIVLREKKRDKSKKMTFRRVSMSNLLAATLTEWLANGHPPGSPSTICQGEVVERSRTRSKTTGHQSGDNRATTLNGRLATVRERTLPPGQVPLTVNEATYHFKQTLAGSKWEVVRGFHVFRHSFASNLAREGVDQRTIDDLMGHQTEEMRKRYRHLFPEQRHNAVKTVFG